MSWEYYIDQREAEKSPLELVRAVISDNNLKSKSRKREDVYTRQFLMWFLDKKTKLSLKSIGKEFNRDHATVIHSKKCYEDALAMKDEVYFKYFSDIKDFLEQFDFPDKYRYHANTKKCSFTFVLDSKDYLMLQEVANMKKESIAEFLRKLVRRSVSKYNIEKKV